ncbi:hypothetical protein ACFX2C_015024 [Malus domestica]
MAHPNPPIDEEYMDYISINFEDILDLEEMNVDSVHLVGLLIVNQEPSQIIVNIKVSRAKDNVYSISWGRKKWLKESFKETLGSSTGLISLLNCGPCTNPLRKSKQLRLFFGFKFMKDQTFSGMSNVHGTSHPVQLGIEATITAGVTSQGSADNADVSAGTSRKAIILEWGNLDHLKSFGTHYRNGTLTLTIMSFH